MQNHRIVFIILILEFGKMKGGEKKMKHETKPIQKKEEILEIRLVTTKKKGCALTGNTNGCNPEDGWPCNPECIPAVCKP